MVKLYYTGAEKHLEPQKQSGKSIGGYISSTVIPNGVQNTLFNDISVYGKSKKTFEVICIALKNESDKDVKELKLHCEIDEDYNVFCAVVKPSLDECSNLVFEKLDTRDSLPYVGDFNDISNVKNQILIGDVKGGEYIGLFLQKKTVINSNDKKCIAVDFESQNDTETIENFKLVFDWL